MIAPDPARLRIGDAQREAAARDLGEHYAQGRITTEEHHERLDRIWAARTDADLWPVFADLPGPFADASRPPAPVPHPIWSRPKGPSAGVAPALTRVLLILVLVGIVAAHLPVILFALVLWLLLSRSRPGPARPHGARRRRAASW